MNPLTATTQDEDDRTFVSLIEMDLAEGDKRPVTDLSRYLTLKDGAFTGKPYWRHKESQTVYQYVGLSLAATGIGKLALMVHYAPLDENLRPVPGVMFGRQHEPFMIKFETVAPRNVWDRA